MAAELLEKRGRITVSKGLRSTNENAKSYSIRSMIYQVLDIFGTKPGLHLLKKTWPPEPSEEQKVVKAGDCVLMRPPDTTFLLTHRGDKLEEGSFMVSRSYFSLTMMISRVHTQSLFIQWKIRYFQYLRMQIRSLMLLSLSELLYWLHSMEGPGYMVSYIDGSQGRRSVAHRLSFVEMVVPYGDPNDPVTGRMHLTLGKKLSLKKDLLLETEYTVNLFPWIWFNVLLVVIPININIIIIIRNVKNRI